MAKTNKRAKARAAKLAAKRSRYEARKSKAPEDSNSKYAERRRARNRGEPMKARPVPPWWARLTGFRDEDFAKAGAMPVRGGIYD